MIIVDVKQGSPEWHEYRKKGINATDAACIMGHDPYLDIIGLWKKKIGIIDDELKGNLAMLHGKKMEDVARSWFINNYHLNFMPVCVKNDRYPFIQASLDGISDGLDLILEIKCPLYKANFDKHQKEIPINYFFQIQHQLLASGVDKAYFLSFYGFNKYFIKTHVEIVNTDSVIQNEMLKRCILFQNCLVENIQPNLSDFNQYSKGE